MTEFHIDGVSSSPPDAYENYDVAEGLPPATDTQQANAVAGTASATAASYSTYTPYKVTFAGLENEDYIAFPAPHAKAFRMACQIDPSKEKIEDFLKNISQSFIQYFEKVRMEERSNRANAGVAEDTDKPTAMKKSEIEAMLFSVLTTAVQVAGSDKIWCLPSTENPFSSNNEDQNGAAVIFIKNWKTWLAIHTGASLSQTPEFADFHGAWIRSIQAILAPTVKMMIQGIAEGKDLKTWPEEKKLEFNQRITACAHAFDILKLPSGEYETTANPRAVCCNAAKMVDEKIECSKETDIEDAALPPWVPKPKKYLGTWGLIDESEIAPYLRNRPWIWWARNHTFFKDVESRGFFERIGYTLAAWTVAAIAWAGIGGGLAWLVLRRFVTGLSFWWLASKMVNPLTGHGVGTAVKKLLKLWRGRGGGGGDPRPPATPKGKKAPTPAPVPASAPAPAPALTPAPTPAPEANPPAEPAGGQRQSFSILPEAHEMFSPEVIAGTALTFTALLTKLRGLAIRTASAGASAPKGNPVGLALAGVSAGLLLILTPRDGMPAEHTQVRSRGRIFENAKAYKDWIDNQYYKEALSFIPEIIEGVAGNKEAR